MVDGPGAMDSPEQFAKFQLPVDGRERDFDGSQFLDAKGFVAPSRAGRGRAYGRKALLSKKPPAEKLCGGAFWIGYAGNEAVRTKTAFILWLDNRNCAFPREDIGKQQVAGHNLN